MRDARLLYAVTRHRGANVAQASGRFSFAAAASTLFSSAFISAAMG
jgi:hypothetical protein